jgi:hypothetical protein
MDLGLDVENIRKEIGAAAEKFLMSEDVLINRLSDTSKLFQARYETGDVNLAVKKAISDLPPFKDRLSQIKSLDFYTKDHIKDVIDLQARIRSESAPVNELEDCLRFFYDNYQKLSVDLKVTAKKCARKLENLNINQGLLLEKREKELTYLLNGVVVSYDEDKLFARYEELQNKILSINRFEISRYIGEITSLLSDLDALEGTIGNSIKEREKLEAFKRSFLVDLMVCNKPIGFEAREVRVRKAELQAARGMVVITGRLGRPEANVHRMVISKDGGQTWEEISGLKYWLYDFYPKPGAVYNICFKIIGADSKIISADTPEFSIIVKD